MFLEFLLSPITSKDNILGGSLDNLSKIRDSRRSAERSLRAREVAALEKIADKLTTDKGE